MNACHEYRPLLLLFAGEDLEPAQLEAVRAHLAGCASCGAAVAAARRARAAYRAGALGRGDEEIDLWPAVRARIRAEAAAEAGALSAALGAGASVHQEPATRTDRVPVPTTGRLLRFTAALAAAAAVVLIARPILQGLQGWGSPARYDATGPVAPLERPTLVQVPPGELERPRDAAEPAVLLPGAVRPGSALADATPAPSPASPAAGLVRVDDPTQPSLRESVHASGTQAVYWFPVVPEDELERPEESPFLGVPASEQRRVH